MCGVELPDRDPGLDFTAILCEKISSQRQPIGNFTFIEGFGLSYIVEWTDGRNL